ncbi:ankyrin repeat domain-containing protein [Stieleria sp. ICT_E10.1]|uniref:ankyrin repeat domain-containing protein n=1 Tax=Stieleria sedimenti TaxID=2976331 RepID=UPI0021802C20|nr:ankyrin repeat domain-containing protein [Stieleria sedimenti]MCS7470916.1 ankyrin repeat domain-containing protein [Stieleria sedimenti]
MKLDLANEGTFVFGLSTPEFAIVALMCLPIVFVIGVVLKKMGYSDLTAIGLALLMLTPLNWLVLAYLVFVKWPIHEELELLRRQVDDKVTLGGIQPTVREGQSNPLHVAICKGYSDVVGTLISQGVDVDARTADGQTPLQLAVACGQNEIAELRRRHGATS